MGEYTIAQGLAVRGRMDLLAAALRLGTEALLDRVGIPLGSRCIDLGCGGGHVTMELARRAGPTGSALGIDLDAELLEVARGIAGEAGVDNIEFRHCSVFDLAEANVDVAYARLLLMHLSHPDDVISAVRSMLNPDGVFVVEDADFLGSFTYPDCPAYSRLVDWYRETVRIRGGDPELGRRLPTAVAAAGLTDLRVTVSQPVQADGPLKRLVQESHKFTRAAVLAEDVASADEYDSALDELISFTSSPGTLVAGPRIIQVAGRRRA